MQILFVWQKCEFAGVETWMLGLAQLYRQFGHTCELFLFRRGPFAEEIPADIPVHFGGLEALLRLVRDRRFDVVHGAMCDWDLGVTAVRSLGSRLVVTNHGHGDPGWNASNCDALLSCSRWGAEEQQRLSGVPVRTVLNGVDLDRFHPPAALLHGPPIVAWVGRGADLHQKRINLLAQAAARLRAGGCRLWVADPNGQPVLPPEVSEPLRANAEYWGPVSFARMPAFYQEVAASGGCLLSTSAFEGLSMAYLEAQACGCPVIGPDVPGVHEGLPPSSGSVLFPDGTTPSDIADLVLATLGDREGMAARRRIAREYVVQRFGLARTAREYLAIYSEPLPRRQVAAHVRNRCLWPTPAGYRRFVKRNWGVGNDLFLTSRRFATAGDWELASASVVTSFLTCPTLFIRARRTRHLLACVWRGLRARRVTPAPHPDPAVARTTNPDAEPLAQWEQVG